MTAPTDKPTKCLEENLREAEYLIARAVDGDGRRD